jgi:hypothetical protein
MENEEPKKDKRKIVWPKKTWRVHVKRQAEDMLYGAAVHVFARLAKRVKGECPRREEVLVAFSDWAMVTADEALHEGRITRDMIESRHLAYRRMSKERIKLCSNWVSCHGSNSIAEIAEAALRIALLEADAEIVEE